MHGWRKFAAVMTLVWLVFITVWIMDLDSLVVQAMGIAAGAVTGYCGINALQKYGDGLTKRKGGE